VAAAGDHFAVLGLTARHDLPRDEVETAYLARAQVWHPDKVAPGETAARRQAMEASAALNEAYRVVRDPISRLEYIVKTQGIDLDSSDENTGAPSPSQAFLIDMIERRDDLEQAKASGGSKAASFRDAVEDSHDEAVDAAIAAVAGGDTPAAAQWLVQRRYWQRLLDEIDA